MGFQLNSGNSLGNKATTEIVELCKTTYNEGKWPNDFTQVVMVPIPKKTKAVECEDHRTISLISLASKIILKFLQREQKRGQKILSVEINLDFEKGVALGMQWG